MKREDIIKQFPDATKEQVDAIMNLHGGELNAVKKELEGVRGDLAAANASLATAQGESADWKSKYDEANGKLTASMTAEEKLEALQAQMEASRAEFALKSAKLDAREIFAAAGCFDADDIAALVDQVASGDADDTKAKAQRIVDMTVKQREAVEKSVKAELLKSNPKPQGGAGADGVLTKADFLKLPYSQQLAMKAENPNIVSQLK